jgi:hypothetical protein
VARRAPGPGRAVRPGTRGVPDSKPSFGMSRKAERGRAEMLVILSQCPVYTDSDTFREAVRLAKSGEDCQCLPPELARYWRQMCGMFLRDHENLLRVCAEESRQVVERVQPGRREIPLS